MDNEFSTASKMVNSEIIQNLTVSQVSEEQEIPNIQWPLMPWDSENRFGL